MHRYYPAMLLDTHYVVVVPEGTTQTGLFATTTERDAGIVFEESQKTSLGISSCYPVM